nr:protein-tyrosine sulfotransferase [Ipomoea batatas]
MGEMIHFWKVIFSLVLLLSVSTASEALVEDDFEQCEHTVKKWASSSLESEVSEDKHLLRDLLFFLHVPRTGGRTYFHCFLKKLYANSLECPRSYDKLRFDPRKPNCRLLATHDDYSLMSKLPNDITSVVTIIRNPIDRVFSAYEFSIEVAARFLVHPNLTSATRMSGRIRSKSKGVSTLDIWPWKYLVPWMREDLFARREARTRRGETIINGNDPYNMQDIVIPLHKYINEPIAQDLIHNGATFQVAGLTNNTYMAESHHVRHCVLKYRTLGQYVLEVAKKRLDGMLYVGITENHKESAAMFANVVGTQVISQLTPSSFGKSTGAINNSEQSDPSRDSDSDTESKPRHPVLAENTEAINKNMTAGKLIEAYEICMKTLRSTQAQRRTNSLKRVSPANFTKEARRLIPGELIQEITQLNSLDMQLYEYAQHIFEKQKKLGTQRMVVSVVGDDGMLSNSDDAPWRPLYFALPFMFLFLFIFLIVNAKRRTSKVKL